MTLTTIEDPEFNEVLRRQESPKISAVGENIYKSGEKAHKFL